MLKTQSFSVFNAGTNTKAESIQLKKVKKFFSISLVISMVLNVYVFPLIPVMTLGELYLLLLIPYFLIKSRKLQLAKSNLLIFVYCVYALLITLGNVMIYGLGVMDPIERLLRDAFYYVLIFLVFYNCFDFKYFKKCIYIFCTLLSIFLIIQTIVYYAFGYLVPGFLLGAQLSDGNYIGRELYNKYLSYASNFYLKPNGFLCEPAQCSQCLFFGLILLVFDKKYNKYFYVLAVLFSIGSILTLSTTALFAIILVWSAWLITKGRKHMTKAIVLVIMSFAFVIIALVSGNLNNIISSLRRLFVDSSDTNSSVYFRIFKGMDIFMNLPLFAQLFGIGFGNYVNLASSFQLSGVLTNNEYMNSFSYILISSGIIGLLIIGLFLFKLFRNSNLQGKMLILGLIFLSLGSSIYSTIIMIWFMVAIWENKRGGYSSFKL